MTDCHHLSRGWLLTDARLAGHGAVAARHVPPFSVILIRSDALSPREWRQLVRRMRRIGRVRRMMVLVAGVSPAHARRLGVDGVHLRDRSVRRAAQARRLGLTTSAPVHNKPEARAAARASIDHALISPLFATRSHVGAPCLSHRQFVTLALLTRAGAVALGGMTRDHHRGLLRRDGERHIRPQWAAIDAWDAMANRP